MSLSINDSVYSCVFFFLTGLHFFHLVVGLLLLSLLSWSSSFPHLSLRSLWSWLVGSQLPLPSRQPYNAAIMLVPRLTCPLPYFRGGFSIYPVFWPLFRHSGHGIDGKGPQIWFLVFHVHLWILDYFSSRCAHLHER